MADVGFRVVEFLLLVAEVFRSEPIRVSLLFSGRSIFPAGVAILLAAPRPEVLSLVCTLTFCFSVLGDLPVASIPGKIERS